MAKIKKGLTGTCKLTGEVGPFVKSHLIPRALTPPRQGGEPFAQTGGRRRPKRRLDSWYDLSLVTQAGENILTEYDTYAIQELRRLKLIWQSWGPMLELCTSDWQSIPGTPNGLRRVVFRQPAKMRLFFLSLLWRAAATDLLEFSEVSLRASDLRRLRGAINGGFLDLPDNFFPITLTQISTLGPPHNLAPIYLVKEAVKIGSISSRAEPIFRFYFDGLVAHVHTNANAKTIDQIRPMLVGQEDGTTLSMVTWKGSWQAMNLHHVIADAEHEYPGGIARAESRGSRSKSVT